VRNGPAAERVRLSRVCLCEGLPLAMWIRMKSVDSMSRGWLYELVGNCSIDLKLLIDADGVVPGVVRVGLLPAGILVPDVGVENVDCCDSARCGFSLLPKLSNNLCDPIFDSK